MTQSEPPPIDRSLSPRPKPYQQSSQPKITRWRGTRSARVKYAAQEFIVKGLPGFDPTDPYYLAVSLSWKAFGLVFVAAELAINTLFATLYMLEPSAIANQARPGFLSAFFFSLETLATVGYGEMYPNTLYGHVISSLEILTGLVFTAIMTGLLFIRFSKPRAKVLYADHPVVAMNNGQKTLMLRIGNARMAVLHNVALSMHVLIRSTSDEGQRQVNIVELPLVRARIPIFAILFTVMHVIDEASPIFGLEGDVDEIEGLRGFIGLSARDPAIGQEVSDLHTFIGPDIRFGMRYVDAVAAKGTKVVANYQLLSAIEPDIGPRAEPGDRARVVSLSPS